MDVPRRRVPGELVFVLILLLFSLTALWQSWRISGFTGWSSPGGLPMLAGLVMVSAPNSFALWTRLTALVAALLFTVSAFMILWGAPLLPSSSPLPPAGYPFLVLTFIGWIWTLLKPAR